MSASGSVTVCVLLCVCVSQKCHPECSGGCTGKKATDCKACKHFTNETNRWVWDADVVWVQRSEGCRCGLDTRESWAQVLA